MKLVATTVLPCRWRSRSTSRWNVARQLGTLAVCACLLGAGNAIALDQPITGKKLWLKSTPKFVLLSKDAGIDIGGADPHCPGGDSSLVIDDGVDTATFLLPCANWRANHSGGFRYRNSSAPQGPSAVKFVMVKGGLLKVIGKDLGGLSLPNGAGTIDVVLNLDGIAHRYCMSFTGTGNGSRFVAKNAPAGSCPSPLPCDATTGGLCWFLGAKKTSCAAACAIKGRAYDSATMTYAGSSGTDANCIAVLDALGVAAGPLDTLSTCSDGLGCLYALSLRARCSAPPTNSSSSGVALQRVCACQ